MTENEAIKILTLSEEEQKEFPNLKEIYAIAVKALEEVQCQTAHCGRCKPHADFGENTSPIEPYRYRPQNYSGMTADCRSFI